MAGFAQPVKPNRGGVPGFKRLRRNNYSRRGSVVSPQNKYSLKVDHAWTTSHRMPFFYNNSNLNQKVGPGGPPGLPLPLWDGQVQTFETEAFRLTYDWTLSPRMLNHFAIAETCFTKSAPRKCHGGWKDKICMKNVPDCDINFAAATFSELSSWGATSFTAPSSRFGQ